jgi:N-acetylglucosamine-6-phosphate deacetylase
MTAASQRIAGHVVTPGGVVRGRVDFDGVIREVASDQDASDRWILPGFIDGHVHGGGGADTMDGPAGVRTLARFHGRHGTTTLLPTTVTAPWPDVLEALEGVAEAMAAPDPDAAEVVGAHLEGPFVSALRLGAQPPYDRDASEALADEVLARGVVRVATMAPERAGVIAAAVRFAAAGVRVSVGHTVASYDEVRAFAATVRAQGGVVGFTHLFNAMGGLQGRAPGVVGAALADPDAWAELILDGHHVHAGSVLAARRALGARMILVSDAIRAAGTDAETSELGGRTIRIDSGTARTAEGALAGSLLTLDVALRNAVAIGLSVETASHMLSAAPAAYLGLTDRGALEPGRRADLVVLSPELQVEAVYVAGRRISP